MSCNARFKLINYYTLHKAYLTPEKIYRYFHSTDAACQRCGIVDTDFMHMVWSCGTLTCFWEKVVEAQNKALNRDAGGLPEACFLRLFPKPKVKKKLAIGLSNWLSF